jgi:hypothetical protein
VRVLLLAARPLGAATLSFNTPVTGVNGGGVIPTASTWSLAIATSGTATPVACARVPSPAAAAGSFSMTGTKKATWTLAVTGITQPAGPVQISAVTLSSTSGTFSASAGASGTITLGLTLANVGAALPAEGTCTGAVALRVTQAGGATASTSIPVTLKVDSTLTLTLTNAGLSFGAIFPPASGSSTVQLTPAGARTVTSGAATLGAFNGGRAAAFTVAGSRSRTYTIALSQPNGTTLSDGNGHTLAFTLSSSPSGTGTLSSSGSQALTVGGTVTLTSTTAKGTYSGLLGVTVAYN